MPSVELSPKQIKTLFSFVEKKKVKYLDVQYELVDHLASAIEEEMSSNNQITFDQSLKSVYNRFPITGFDRLVREKEKAMNKYWRNKKGSIILQYFSLPKIIMTILLILLFGSLASINSNWCITSIIILGLIALIYNNSNWFIGSTKHSKKYLVLDTFLKATTGLIFFPVAIVGILQKAIPSGPLLFTDWQFYLLVGYCTLSFIFIHASLFEFPKIIKTEISNKYAHLNMELV